MECNPINSDCNLFSNSNPKLLKIVLAVKIWIKFFLKHPNGKLQLASQVLRQQDHEPKQSFCELIIVVSPGISALCTSVTSLG